MTLLQEQVAEAVGEGADLNEVEVAGDRRTRPWTPRSRDALWLYAWGLLERDDSRPALQPVGARSALVRSAAFARRRRLRHPRQPPRLRGGPGRPRLPRRRGDLVPRRPRRVRRRPERLRRARPRARGDLPGRQPRPRGHRRAGDRGVLARRRDQRPLDAQGHRATRTASSSTASSPRARTRRRPLPREPARPGLGVRPDRAARQALPRRRAPADRAHRPLAHRPRVRPRVARRARPSSSAARGGDHADLAEGEWLLNPGSVGQPRDGDPRAAWLLLDTTTWRAEWRRTEYDIEGAAAAIRGGRASGFARRAPWVRSMTVRRLPPLLLALVLGVAAPRSRGLRRRGRRGEACSPLARVDDPRGARHDLRAGREGRVRRPRAGVHAPRPRRRRAAGRDRPPAAPPAGRRRRATSSRSRRRVPRQQAGDDGDDRDDPRDGARDGAAGDVRRDRRRRRPRPRRRRRTPPETTPRGARPAEEEPVPPEDTGGEQAPGAASFAPPGQAKKGDKG